MKLVYLHGIGDGDPHREWLESLNRALTRDELATVSNEDVVAPHYPDLLKGVTESVPHPPVTYTEKFDEQARFAFERAQAEVERALRSFDGVRTFGFHRVPRLIIEPTQSAAISTRLHPLLAQVSNYLNDKALRAAVLSRILDDLPSDGQIVLLGHSLGSVIAIDILDHLPPTMTVKRFVTIGSPGGSPVLHRNSSRILKRFPYGRVHDWTNVLDPADVVTAGKPLAAQFPGAQDIWITGAAAHAAKEYTKHPAVARLIGGSLISNTDLVRSSGSVTRRLDNAEAVSLLAIEFANQVAARIANKDAAGRYEAAIDLLRDSYVADMTERADGRPLPPEFAEIADGRMPAYSRRWTLNEAVRLTVLMSYTNVIAPYEVNVGDASVEAVPSFMVQLGYPSGTAKKVQQAIAEVNEFLDKKPLLGTKTRIAIAAAGVALLAAGPVGLAIAAAPGLAGAAAITSGLAAFGPGGMAGGIAMLSGLGSTGGMIAAAAATVGSGAQEHVLDPTSLAIKVAIAQALKNVGEDYDTELWSQLTIADSETSAQLNRLRAFSDEKSPEVTRLESARTLVNDLQRYMREHGLVPTAILPAISDADAGSAEASSSWRSQIQLPWS